MLNVIFSCADNSESFRLTEHWFRDFAPTHSLMIDQITNLCEKNIVQASTWPFHLPHLPSQQHLCEMVVFMSSLALGHGGTQLPLGGNEWHLLCLKPCFLHMGGLWGHEVMVLCSQNCFQAFSLPCSALPQWFSFFAMAGNQQQNKKVFLLASGNFNSLCPVS